MVEAAKPKPRQEPKKVTPPKPVKWQGKSIQDSIERVTKARMVPIFSLPRQKKTNRILQERERVQYMKDHGLVNTKPLMTPTGTKSKFGLWSTSKRQSRKSPREKAAGTALTKMEPIFEMNLKFGDNIENVKCSPGDDLAAISREISKRNSTISNLETKNG